MSALSHGTIVTLGGGGFSMSASVTSLIDDLLLTMTGQDYPRVCFIPTASGDSQGYVERFEKAFAEVSETSVLQLFRPDTWDTKDLPALLDVDVVNVGGGSTANLLALWRLHGLVEPLRQACSKGTILAGISAGMNCWFEASSTDSFGSLSPLWDGLDFLPGGACPHYRGEEGRQDSIREWVATGAMPDTWAVDDGAALIWCDGEPAEAVAEVDDAIVMHVIGDGEGSAQEIPLPVRRLQG